jgi:hypothetical protein
MMASRLSEQNGDIFGSVHPNSPITAAHAWFADREMSFQIGSVSGVMRAIPEKYRR